MEKNKKEAQNADTMRPARKLMAACVSHRMNVTVEYALRRIVPRRNLPAYWLRLAEQVRAGGWRSLNLLLTERRRSSAEWIGQIFAPSGFSQV